MMKTGDIEALPMWSGHSVAPARRTAPRADIIVEFVSGP